MSNSAIAVPVATPHEAAHGFGQQDSNQGTRTVRNDRSTGKGRRRRAAAEQRRIEQQRWGQYLHDTDEEIFVAPRSGNRRRARRSSRQLVQDELDDFSPYGSSNDDVDLDVALAISLSLSETSQISHEQSSTGQEVLDMSYENLVLLENVKCVAASCLVRSLSGFIFEGTTQNCSTGRTEELCAICQNEFEGGDYLMLLPCTHKFHHACGSEWLLQYSKLCPVCKHDVSEKV